MAASAEEDVPFDTFRKVAARLNESVDAYKNVAAATLAAPNSAVVCNILHTLSSLIRKRLGAPPALSHQLRKLGADIELTINYVPSLFCDDVRAIRQISLRIWTVQFVFRSPDTADPLAYGCIIILIKPTSLTVNVHTLYTPPPQRRARTADIDWDQSAVMASDKNLVLAIIDDVYNMQKFNPVDMWVSLEPIENVDYTEVIRTRKRNAASQSDVLGDDSTSATHGELVGYCLHFVNVPSCEDTFPAFLMNKYQTRCIGYAILFPQLRKNARLSLSKVIPQRLVIMISTESTLTGVGQEHAISGAKRLCQKMLLPKTD